jgi:dipeptidyl aminopeptidase/acylaminoacyl peptidase
VTIRSVSEWSGWVFDTGRGTLARLTHNDEVTDLFWTDLEGQRVAFNRRTGRWETQDIFWQRTDGTETPEMLVRDSGALCSWSSDGQRFAVDKAHDIWVGTLDGSSATLQRVTDTPHWEWNAEFSPDGRWLAYTSNESGRLEVYVQPWPGPGPRQQVSVDGGTSPAWNPNGREIFFLDVLPDPPPFCGTMMVVDVSLEPTLRLGRPRTLFEWSGDCPNCGPARCFDIAADGLRFFKTEPLPTPKPPPVTHIHLIQNWLDEVEARVPRDR